MGNITMANYCQGTRKYLNNHNYGYNEEKWREWNLFLDNCCDVRLIPAWTDGYHNYQINCPSLPNINVHILHKLHSAHAYSHYTYHTLHIPHTHQIHTITYTHVTHRRILHIPHTKCTYIHVTHIHVLHTHTQTHTIHIAHSNTHSHTQHICTLPTHIHTTTLGLWIFCQSTALC